MIAKKLRRLRRDMDMTQEQLAVELGVSQSLVCQMERGRAIITARTAKQLTAVRHSWVRRSHYLQASQLTGKTPAELGAPDVGPEEL